MASNNTTQQQERSNPSNTKDGSLESVTALVAENIKQSIGTKNKFTDVLKRIAESAELKEKVDLIRSAATTEEQDFLKKKLLPWFSLAEFRNDHRENDNFVEMRHLQFDLDDLNIDPKILKEQFKSDPTIMASFISPTGKGLRAFSELEESITDIELFKEVYNYHASIFENKYGIKLDTCGEKAAQACFFSSDSEIYINPNYQRLPVIKGNLKEIKHKVPKVPVLETVLAGTSQGNRIKKLTREVGFYWRKGMNADQTLLHIREWNKYNKPPLDDQEVESTLRDMYERYDKVPIKYTEKDDNYYRQMKDGLRQITTFIIEPKELLVLPNGDCLRCTVRTSAGYEYSDVLIENPDWHSKARLLKALGHQDCSFLGSENDVQGLCSFVNAGIDVRKKGIKVIGNIDDIWVTANCNITKDGSLETLKIIPYDKGADAFYRKIEYPAVSDAEYQIMLSGFCEDILKINTAEVIVPWLGWLFATPLKPKIQEIFGGFPVVFVHGSQGSGKTSTAQQFMRMLGYKDNQPYLVTMKSFPMLKILSSTNAIPVFLDEYKIHDMTDEQKNNIHRYMRKCYNSEVESKGRQDQTVEDYVLGAPTVVMGEWDINEPAIKERLLVIRFTTAMKKSKEMQDALVRIKPLHLEAFMPRYIQYILGVDIVQVLKDSLDEVQKTMPKYNTVAPRILNNLVVMVAGLQMFRNFVTSLNIPMLQYDLKHILINQLKEITGSDSGQVRSAVDQLIEELGIMWQKNEKQIMPAPMGRDPLIMQVPWWKRATVGEKDIQVIAIRFNKIFPEFKEYAQRTKYEGELLDKNSYGKMFNETDYVYSKDLPVDFDGKKHRCLCIDVKKAQEAGIELEGFGIENVTDVTVGNKENVTGN